MDHVSDNDQDIDSDSNNENILHSGQLQKINISRSPNRWFVLTDSSLKFYKDSDRRKLKGKLKTSALVAMPRTSKSSDFTFITFEKTIRVRAENEEIASEQLNVIKILGGEIESRSRTRSIEVIKKNIKKHKSTSKTKSQGKDENSNQIDPEPVSKVSEGTKELEDKLENLGESQNKEDESQAETCEAVLEDPLGAKWFSEYLKGEYTEQHLHFQLEVKEFSLLIEKGDENSFPDSILMEIFSKSFSLFDTYIIEGTDTTINIGKKVRDPITFINRLLKDVCENSDWKTQDKEEKSQRINAIVHLYQCAQLDVFKMLRGTFRRFKRSKIYSKFVDEIKRTSVCEVESISLSPRAACKKEDCNCEQFTVPTNKRLKTCTSCTHFYEEHATIDLDLNENFDQFRGKQAESMVSMKQRQKLQMLLGMSEDDFHECEAELKTDSRKKFLEETIFAILNCPTHPLHLEERRFTFKKVTHCFLSKDLISCISKRLSVSNTEARHVAEEMLDYELFKPVMKTEQGFIGGKFQYRLTRKMLKRIDELQKISNLDEVSSMSDVSDQKKIPSKVSKTVTDRTESQDGNLGKSNVDEEVDFVDLFLCENQRKGSLKKRTSKKSVEEDEVDILDIFAAESTARFKQKKISDLKVNDSSPTSVYDIKSPSEPKDVVSDNSEFDYLDAFFNKTPTTSSERPIKIQEKKETDSTPQPPRIILPSSLPRRVQDTFLNDPIVENRSKRSESMADHKMKMGYPRSLMINESGIYRRLSGLSLQPPIRSTNKYLKSDKEIPNRSPISEVRPVIQNVPISSRILTSQKIRQITPRPIKPEAPFSSRTLPPKIGGLNLSEIHLRSRGPPPRGAPENLSGDQIQAKSRSKSFAVRRAPPPQISPRKPN